jgi:hypothetical protein
MPERIGRAMLDTPNNDRARPRRCNASAAHTVTTPRDRLKTHSDHAMRTASLSELLGSTVEFGSGSGTLNDLGVAIEPGSPRITSVHVRRGDAIERITSPVVVSGVGPLAPEPLGQGHQELLLKRDVLDRQVFDGVGARLSRVADVCVQLHDGELRVIAVETGVAAILRRLGAGRIASRLRPQLIAWEDLHLVSGPGHALQLSSPAAAVHRLDPAVVAELVRRAPTRQSAEVLEGLAARRRESVRASLARAAARRRSSDPLSARKHAPS